MKTAAYWFPVETKTPSYLLSRQGFRRERGHFTQSYHVVVRARLTSQETHEHRIRHAPALLAAVIQRTQQVHLELCIPRVGQLRQPVEINLKHSHGPAVCKS